MSSTEAVWTTQDGRKIPIREMDDNHLRNTILMLRNRGFIGRKEQLFYLNCTPPTADMASYCFEQEMDDAFSRRPSVELDELAEEAERRGIKP